MKVIVSVMRLVSFVLVSIIFGTALAFGLGGDPVLFSGGVALASLIPSGVIGSVGVLATLLGTHTGAASYTGSIDAPISRLYVDADSTTALATVTAAKLSLMQATKKRTGTMIPELSFAILADIAGFIDAIYYQYTATFRIKFSIPIGSGGAYDPEGGSLTYNLSNCTAADTIKVYAIDDARRVGNYIDVTPIATISGGIKQIDCTNANFIFLDPATLTRIKINYAGGLSIEYVGEEIDELARVVNPVHKLTDAFLLIAGYTTVAGINVQDAVSVEVNNSSSVTVYLVKYLVA